MNVTVVPEGGEVLITGTRKTVTVNGTVMVQREGLPVLTTVPGAPVAAQFRPLGAFEPSDPLCRVLNVRFAVRVWPLPAPVTAGSEVTTETVTVVGLPCVPAVTGVVLTDSQVALLAMLTIPALGLVQMPNGSVGAGVPMV